VFAIRGQLGRGAGATKTGGLLLDSAGERIEGRIQAFVLGVKTLCFLRGRNRIWTSGREASQFGPRGRFSGELGGRGRDSG